MAGKYGRNYHHRRYVGKPGDRQEQYPALVNPGGYASF
jgi:hypothetical protein